jgi:hypothetical protein
VFVLCLIGFAVTSQRWYERQTAQRADWEEWRSALAKWEQLYYCARCYPDSMKVFIPGDEPQVIPVQQVSEFLYR